MRVSKKYVEINRHFLSEFIAKWPQAGSCIKNYSVIATFNFETGGISTVSHRIGTRACDTPSHAPKPDVKFSILSHSPPTHTVIDKTIQS